MTNLPKIQRKGKIVCPHCGDLASRVKRTLGDRLASLIKPVKRYRCDFCAWTGVFPLEGESERSVSR
jgi:uncharacterized Zn finger protein (UPF0148 family)